MDEARYLRTFEQPASSLLEQANTDHSAMDVPEKFIGQRHGDSQSIIGKQTVTLRYDNNITYSTYFLIWHLRSKIYELLPAKPS